MVGAQLLDGTVWNSKPYGRPSDWPTKPTAQQLRQMVVDQARRRGELELLERGLAMDAAAWVAAAPVDDAQGLLEWKREQDRRYGPVRGVARTTAPQEVKAPEPEPAPEISIEIEPRSTVSMDEWFRKQYGPQ
jgi:hypothetical protein